MLINKRFVPYEYFCSVKMINKSQNFSREQIIKTMTQKNLKKKKKAHFEVYISVFFVNIHIFG